MLELKNEFERNKDKIEKDGKRIKLNKEFMNCFVDLLFIDKDISKYIDFNLTRIDLSEYQLDGIDFGGLNLDGVRITGADFTGAIITEEQKRALSKYKCNNSIRYGITNKNVENIDYIKCKKYVKNLFN